MIGRRAFFETVRWRRWSGVQWSSLLLQFRPIDPARTISDHRAGLLLMRCTRCAARLSLPSFNTAPGDTDTLMVVVGIVLIGSVLAVGNFYLHLHTLPERMAHKSQKLQFEIVAVLGLLALFTHNHLFWVIGLFLAMVDLPDFSTPLRSIAGSVDKIAGVPPGDEATEIGGESATHAVAAEAP